jgi:hypothetical protein
VEDPKDESKSRCYAFCVTLLFYHSNEIDMFFVIEVSGHSTSSGEN